jgi:hypothetical protein
MVKFFTRLAMEEVELTINMTISKVQIEVEQRESAGIVFKGQVVKGIK